MHCIIFNYKLNWGGRLRRTFSGQFWGNVDISRIRSMLNTLGVIIIMCFVKLILKNSAPRPTTFHYPSPLARRVKSNMPEPHPGKVTRCSSSLQLYWLSSRQILRLRPQTGCLRAKCSLRIHLFGLCGIIKF